jgi:CHAD domain-containing protein
LRENDAVVEAEATLKSLVASSPGPRDRREISETLPKADPDMLVRAPGPVGERIRSLASARPLEPLFVIRTTRRRFGLRQGSVEIGELVLDDTSIPLHHDDIPVALQRVEVESAVPDSTAVEAFVVELSDACRLQPAARTKFESGLAAHGLSPPASVDLGPTDVDPSMTLGEVAFASLRTHFPSFLEHEPGARLGEEPEEVHDMRVAIRRVRAAIALFGDALPPRSRWLRDEFRWVADSLGAVRDLDVQLAQAAEWAQSLGPEDRRALTPIVEILEDRRRNARGRMIRDLDSPRFERLVTECTEMLQRGPSAQSPTSRSPVVKVAPDLLGKPFRKVRRAGDRIDTSSSPSEFHALRIKCKRLRYALEFLAPVYRKPARRLVKRLVAVQDLLGLHQDAQVAMDQIRSMVHEEGARLGADTLFLLGHIADRYDRQAADLRTQFPAVYQKLRGKAWKDLRRALDASAGAG